MEEKIKEFWKTSHIEPQLVRQEVMENKEDADLAFKQSLISNESPKNETTVEEDANELTEEQK